MCTLGFFFLQRLLLRQQSLPVVLLQQHKVETVVLLRIVWPGRWQSRITAAPTNWFSCMKLFEATTSPSSILSRSSPNQTSHVEHMLRTSTYNLLLSKTMHHQSSRSLVIEQTTDHPLTTQRPPSFSTRPPPHSFGPRARLSRFIA